MESVETELAIKTFYSVLELVRDEPTAIIDDSSYDKIVDSLYEVCKADSKYLDSVFQSVPRVAEILEQLVRNVNSKAATFGIRLLEIIVFKKACYQSNTSLLKKLLKDNSQPNVVCAVLNVLKAVLNSHEGMCWLLEEQMHLLVLDQLGTSSFFVARATEDVIQRILLGCTRNIMDKNSISFELCKKCLDELFMYLSVGSQSSVVPFGTLITLVSHLVNNGMPSELLGYLFTHFWPFDKWFAQFNTRTAEECHSILNLFEICIKNQWITLLRPFLSDDSIVLGHASGLCGRGMVPVAMRLLTLKISLLTQNGIKHNESYYQLLLYPLLFFLQKDDASFLTDDQKVIVMSMRQFVLDHTEQALLSALKGVNYAMKVLNNEWWTQCLELCISLLGTCTQCSTELQYKLTASSQHKIVTKLLVILSEVFEDDRHDCVKIKCLVLIKQLASYLVVVVQKRSFPLQIVCKSLYLIGRVLTTLLQPDVGVAADLVTNSGCDLLSSIAESLQLCSMDVNWEIRDSCIEMIGSMAHEQISDGMIQFLSSSKLCDLLVTHGLMDVEPCVKASTILSLASVMTNPPLAKLFMQHRNDHFSNHLNVAHTILEFTDTSSHETTVRLHAWRAFSTVCKRNSELVGLLMDGNDLQMLSTCLSQGIADDNWEIKIEVMEILMLIYQSTIGKQACIPDYAACCSNHNDSVHNNKCRLLDSVGFFQVLKEAITDYHVNVRKKADRLVDLLESAPHNCDRHQCKRSILEVSVLCHSNSALQLDKSPQEIFLDVLQEILMAAKCEESELRETDCY